MPTTLEPSKAYSRKRIDPAQQSQITFKASSTRGCKCVHAAKRIPAALERSGSCRCERVRRAG